PLALQNICRQSHMRPSVPVAAPAVQALREGSMTNRGFLRLLGLLAAICLAAVIGLSAAGAAAYVSANRLVVHTLLVQDRISDWAVALLEAQAATRGYVMSERDQFLGPYEAGVRRERAVAASLRTLVVD